MKIYSIKPKFQRFLEPAKNLLVKLKVSPTEINLLALAFSIFGGFIIYLSSYKLALLLAIPFIAFIRIALNALDGMVAREIKAKNKKFGEVLNEFGDRLSDVAFFLGACFAFYVNQMLAFLSIIAVLLVSYVGIVGKAAGGSRQYIGLMGKADRMFYLSLACVAVVLFNKSEIMNWFLGFILALSLVTIVQRFIAIKKELYVAGDANRNSENKKRLKNKTKLRKK